MANRTTKVTLQAEVANYLSGMSKASKSTQELGSEAEKLAQKKEAFQLLGGAAVAFGAVAAAGVALATKAAIDWETAWTGVLKTVDGTPEQLTAVEEGLRSLARELPASHAEIAGVAEAAGQLGIETDNVVAFTKVMIDLGETTNLSAQDAATSLARFANIMGTSQGDMSRMGSAIVGLGNNYATTEREILEMSMRLAGAGKQAKLTEGEVFGLATAMSSVGIDAEAGGTAMSLTMKRIAKEVETTGPKLELFARTAGMTSADFAKAWKDDAAGALAVFIEGLGETEAQGMSTTAVLTELGVTGIRESDALLRLSSAQGLVNQAMADGNLAYGENTALLEEAQKRYDTVESKMAAAGNAINDAAIDFGSVLLPAVAAAAEGVAGFAGLLADIPTEIQGPMMAIGVLTAAVLLGGGTFMLAVPKIAAYRAALSTMGVTAQRTAGLLGTVGKAAGLAGLALVALGGMQEVRNWAKDLTGAAVSAEQFAAGLKDGATAAETFEKTMGAAEFDPFSKKASANIAALTGDAAQFSNVLADVQNSWLGLFAEITTFGTADTSLGAAKDNARELDAALSDLVAAGNGERAAEVWEELVRQTDGSTESLERLKALFPQYATAAADAGYETDETGKQIKGVDLAAGEAKASISALADALRGLKSPQLDASAAARDLEAAIDDASDSLQRQRDEYEKANGSLSGFTASLDIGSAAGRTNSAALDAIAAAAARSAAAILENGGSQEESTAAIEAGRAALVEQLAQYGITGEAADAYIAKILATPEEIATTFKVNTTLAQSMVDGFITSNSGRRITVEVGVNGDPVYSNGPGTVKWNARGSVLDFYGNGGMRENHVAQIAPAGAWRVWAEPETGGESYIPLHPSKRARSLDIWAETGKRLGVNGFADGAMVQPRYATDSRSFGMQPAPMSVSLSGARVVLEIGGQQIEGVIREQAVGVVSSAMDRQQQIRDQGSVGF